MLFSQKCREPKVKPKAACDFLFYYYFFVKSAYDCFHEKYAFIIGGSIEIKNELLIVKKNPVITW